LAIPFDDIEGYPTRRKLLLDFRFSKPGKALGAAADSVTAG
jgi:hypothetical protein